MVFLIAIPELKDYSTFITELGFKRDKIFGRVVGKTFCKKVSLHGKKQGRKNSGDRSIVV